MGLGKILLEGRLENLMDNIIFVKKQYFINFYHPFNKKTNFKY